MDVECHVPGGFATITFSTYHRTPKLGVLAAKGIITFVWIFRFLADLALPWGAGGGFGWRQSLVSWQLLFSIVSDGRADRTVLISV